MPVDRRWLVVNRSKIQDRLLKLDELGPTLKLHSDYHSLYLTYGTLIGVAFSLWRAAFLIQTKTNLDDEMKDAARFLGNLIDTNAVSFDKDVTTANWTAGYYINSASLRLYALFLYDETRKILSPETLADLETFQPKYRGDIQLVRLWEGALETFDRVVCDLEAAAAISA